MCFLRQCSSRSIVTNRQQFQLTGSTGSLAGTTCGQYLFAAVEAVKAHKKVSIGPKVQSGTMRILAGCLVVMSGILLTSGAFCWSDGTLRAKVLLFRILSFSILGDRHRPATF